MTEENDGTKFLLVPARVPLASGFGHNWSIQSVSDAKKAHFELQWETRVVGATAYGNGPLPSQDYPSDKKAMLALTPKTAKPGHLIRFPILVQRNVAIKKDATVRLRENAGGAEAKLKPL